jgi:iron complex outermembrane receptor protein
MFHFAGAAGRGTRWKTGGLIVPGLIVPGLILAGCLSLAPPILAQVAPRPQAGSIEGRVTTTEKTGIPGVRVRIEPSGPESYTDEEGRYVFRNVPPGAYTLSLTQGDRPERHANVEVKAGAATQADISVDWPPLTLFSATVTAASRRPERVVSAPAAVEVMSADDIQRESASGQLPRLLADMPGVELVQSGLFDFNPNSRGFNTSASPFVLTTVDGRDTSTPVQMGYQEWAAIPFALDDLQELEFVRGPSSALYGTGAFNGVLTLKTKAPRESLGGKLRITLGELHTKRTEFRQAGGLGDGWYYKVIGGFQQSGDFAQSRDGQVEYAPGLLPMEVVPLAFQRDRIGFGSVRFDKYFRKADLVTFEGGTTNMSGPITVTGDGRTQAGNVNRPWARFNVALPGWNILGFYTGRTGDNELNLSSGEAVYLQEYNVGLEGQWNDYFHRGKGRIVAGGSAGRVRVNSISPSGVQTVFDQPRVANREALFGQVDYDFTSKLKGVLSARFDAGTLYDPRLSPRAALVYSPAARHSFRLTFNDAFQSPTLVQYYLHTAVAPPVNLSAIQQALAPLLGGVNLGFQDIPVLAVGNQDLTTQKIRSFEGGYNWAIRDNLALSVSVYRNWVTDFNSNLLPQVGTSLGRLNPQYGPYVPPAGLSPEAVAALTAALQSALPPSLFNGLSNNPDGSPAFIVLSLKNFGNATSDGVELAVKYALNSRWRFQSSYTFFGFNVAQQVPENPLLPNAPAHQAKASVMYLGKRFNASARYRWVNAFPWSAGIDTGPVPSYSVVDLNANYRINRRWGVGLDVANLLNNVHYEMFGGDLLRRHALAYLETSW